MNKEQRPKESNELYEIRYVDINGKGKTANISAKSESDAIKKLEAEPLVWNVIEIVYPVG